MKTYIFYLFLLISTGLVSGCSSSTVFSNYPGKINPLISSIRNRAALDFSSYMLSESTSNDLILYNMELGRASQVMGKVDVSLKKFNASMAKIQENDRKALVSLSDIGANVAATALNDNAIPYEGEGYERVMTHHYQALNFLKLKRTEDAAVEIRRANFEQEEALKRFEAEVEKAREESQKKRVDSSRGTSLLSSRYAQMDEIAGKVKNSFQNAYTFYLSGFVWELSNQPNDAYIDYKRALEIFPGNRYLQQDVLRMAKTLQMSDELESLKNRFSNIPENISDERSGDVFLIYEEGFVPQKHEIKLPIPVPKVGIVSIAFPIYNAKMESVRTVSVSYDSKKLGETEPICDFRALAVKALSEKAGIIASRQIIRAVAKGASNVAAQKYGGDLGGLAMNIFNYVSENADLRSWLTLPASAQVMRSTIPKGSRKLSIHPQGMNSSYLDLEISPGSRTLIHAVRTGNQLYLTSTTFDTTNSAMN